MKVVCCLPMLLFISATALAQEELYTFTETVMAIQEYCEDRENVTLEFEFSSEELSKELRENNDNQEWKCMLECVASELGIFYDHKFSGRGFFKIIKRIFPEYNEGLNKVVKFITTECQTTKFDDRCEAGYEFMNCLQTILDSEKPLVNLIDFEF